MSGLEPQGLLLADGQLAQNNGVGERLVADTHPATPATQVDSGANDSVTTKLARVGEVSAEGLWYAIPGLKNAVVDDFHNPMHILEKFGGGVAVGALMKTFLPAGGVGRAVAGTVMLGYMAVDVVKPWLHASGIAWNTNNEKKLTTAAQGLGDGIGQFAWSSALGMAGGAAGERLTGFALEKGMGEADYSAFETAKDKFWNTREGKAGRYLVPMKESLDSWTLKAKQNLSPHSIVTRLQGAEALKAAGDASQNIHRNMLGTPLYKSPDFSAFVDSLTGDGPPVPVKVMDVDPVKGIMRVQMLFRDGIGSTPHSLDHLDAGEGRSGADPADGDIRIRVPSVDHSPEPPGVGEESSPAAGAANGGDGASSAKGTTGTGDGKIPSTKPPPVGDQAPPTNGSGGPKTVPEKPGAPSNGQTADGSAPGHDATGKAGDTTGGGKATIATTPAQEFAAPNLKKLAQVAASKQADWANTPEQDEKGIPNKAQIADFRDTIKGPVSAVRGNERMIAAQYDQGLKDVINLADQVDSPEALQQAGAILQFHGQAAAQVLLRNPDTMDLNNLSMELHSIFLQGMRDIGITKLDGKVPSWVAITYDQDSGNFTIAAIKNVMSLPVTVFPRWQTELLSVFAPINGHEQLGHDYIYPELAAFPKEFRASVLMKAVKAALQKNKIPDGDITIGRSLTGDALDIGHDHVMPEKLEALSAEARKNVLSGIMDSAFEKNGIVDTDVKVAGETMKKSEFFIKMLEAEANENTADMMGTAATGTGTPISLGVLLQSLRRGGLLETRNVFGKQFPNLVEPHGFDRWRVKLCAETIRHLADQDPRAMEIAKALDTYADSASRAGSDYVLASMDNKGETIRIPQTEWDAIIPEIVKAQFDTGLPSFRVPQGKVPAGYVDKTVRTDAGEPRGFVDMTLKDVVGKHFMENLKKTDELATAISNAVTSGSTTLDNFNPETFKQQYGVNNIFNASLLAWVRSTARGEDADAALDAVSKISGDLRALYRTGDNPHVAPLVIPTMEQFRKAPVETTKNGILATIGNVVGAQEKVQSFIGARSNLFTGIGGALLAQDLINHYKVMQQILPEQQTSPRPAPAVQRADAGDQRPSSA